MCGDRENNYRYAPGMAFIVTLASSELASITGKLRVEQRLTKALLKERRATGPRIGPEMVLVLGEDSDVSAGARSRHLAWIGVVSRHNTVGAVDKSITVDPLRECMEAVHLDGYDGLLSRLSDELRTEFEFASHVGVV
jgi:hypothetical protein